MVRPIIAYFVTGEHKAANVLLPLIALALVVAAALGAGIVGAPAIGDDADRGLGDAKSNALMAANTATYAGFQSLRTGADASVPSGQEMGDWLREQIDATISMMKDDPTGVGQQIGNGRQWQNDAVQKWTRNYFCPVRQWGQDRDTVRALVVAGVGECSWWQRLAARSPFMITLGPVLGFLLLVVMIALAVATVLASLWAQSTRSAYQWLYRSRVF